MGVTRVRHSPDRSIVGEAGLRTGQEASPQPGTAELEASTPTMQSKEGLKAQG